MSDYAKKPEPTTSAAAAPAKATAPAPKASAAIEMPSGPATYDADRLVARLLQQALVHGEDAFSVYTDQRRANLLVKAETITSIVRELVVVGRDPDVHWDAYGVQLASLANLVEHISYELGADGVALSAQLAAAYAQLAFLVPPSSLGGAPGRNPAARLDTRANLDLARHALGAARTHLAMIPEFESKQGGADAASFCEPLRLHLAIASDAAHAVVERSARRTLKPDVEALSRSMDDLAERLSMNPKLPWHVSFASAFDAESALRAELGLPTPARPYSGTVDPVAAVQQIRAISNGMAPAVRAQPYVDVTSAVHAVRDAVLVVFARQSRAVSDLEQFLAVKDPPSAPSIMTAILDIAANVALMAAAGAIGGAVASLLKPRLEALHVGLVVPRSARSLLSNEENALVVSEILSRGVVSRAVIGDAIKDASKEMFKSAIRGISITRRAPAELPALNVYAHAQKERLAQATELANIAIGHLGPALLQADLETLNVLAHTLEERTPELAYDRQYDYSMREWQNFKARSDAGPPAPREDDVSERDAAVGDAHTSGVLEIGLAFGSDRVVTRRSMRLVGAEPAARLHFRKLARPVGEIGLNKRFEVRLVAPDNDEMLVFGVAPDRGLLVESLSPREWNLLQMLAERQPASLWNVNRALRGEFRTTANSATLRVAEGFVQAASSYNTASLED